MRLAVMPPTRERSEWSGPGVDGQTASAITEPYPQWDQNRERSRITKPSGTVNVTEQSGRPNPGRQEMVRSGEGVAGTVPLEWVAVHEVAARERLFPSVSRCSEQDLFNGCEMAIIGY